MPNKETTIYDIAERLRLSPSTISRGLKGHYTVSLKTQQKIRDTAEAMGYRTNTFAANLRRQRTNTIGIIIPRFNSYFMSEVIAGAEKVTNEAGYNLIISQSLERMDKEVSNVKTMFANRVDGLLVSLAENTNHTDHFNLFLNKGIPVLFFDRVSAGEKLPSIVIDNERAGHLITEHLIKQGAKNIIHITGNQLRNVYADSLKAYQRALAEHGIPYQPQNILVNDLSEQAAIPTANQIIDLKADPVFAANDNCAVSCMNELKRLGVKIPHDIAFAGFNNDMISRNVDPPLTTINYPGFEMGEAAAQNLLKHLAGETSIHPAGRVTLNADLIIRSSSLFRK